MPIVDGLREEFNGRVSAIQLDVAQETNARLQVEYGLRGHPSFAVLDLEGHTTHRFFGPQTAMDLRESMQALISQEEALPPNTSMRITEQ